MSAVWRMDMASTDKMVLLALADAANDDGVTWIALRSKRDDKLDLMKKCSLSDRAIQSAIKRLCDAGFLSRDERAGRGVIYTVTPEGGSAPTPERRSPPPERGSGAPEGGSGNPSLNHQLTLISSGMAPKEKPSRKKPSVALPESFPDEPCLTWAKEKVAAKGASVSVAREVDRFRNHAEQNDRRCANWAAAWRNWIDNACERAPTLGLVQRETQTEHDPWPMRMRAWANDDGWNHVDWGPDPSEPGCRVPAHHLPQQAAE